ncbi:MAG: tripartite tricarboxylate transporter permease [Candidatus Heteroscillospira sp.]|jgi:putative tricarboxylic transport membrane protein
MSLFLNSLLECFEPLNFILMALCAVIGIIFGAIPGLSGGMGMTLILPLTFGMAMHSGFSMLLGMYVGGISGSFIAAVLVGIPGSASSIATCYDGYPMSQKGQTSKALAIGILGSFIGTFFSVIIAVLLSGPIADLALKLGPWELFSLCFCAITLVASLSKGNAIKGLLAAGVGLLAACVGMDPVTASMRFTFGSVYVQGGINMVAAMLGIYALLQIAADFAKGNQKLPDVKAANLKGIGVTLRDFTENIKTILMSFFLGVWIGFLPGMGSSLANLVAYAQCKSSSRNPEEFGTGCSAGIFASEVSNNAAIGGALIPMMSLGIPGDAPTALLLSGLIVHGLQPGPLLISTNPEFVYFVFTCVLLAAIFVMVVELSTKRWFPYLLKIPYHYLYGAILVMCYVGAYTATSSMFNVFMMVLFLGVGILFQMADIPSSPMILAFILAHNLESYFRKGFSYTDQGALPFITRPVSLAFLLIAAFSVFWPVIKTHFSKSRTAV